MFFGFQREHRSTTPARPKRPANDHKMTVRFRASPTGENRATIRIAGTYGTILYRKAKGVLTSSFIIKRRIFNAHCPFDSDMGSENNPPRLKLRHYPKSVKIEANPCGALCWMSCRTSR